MNAQGAFGLLIFGGLIFAWLAEVIVFAVRTLMFGESWRSNDG